MANQVAFLLDNVLIKLIDFLTAKTEEDGK